ncbi:MAG: hypothetical protein ACOCP4_03950 [Candidatus Woesearchaeota archaeon]
MLQFMDKKGQTEIIGLMVFILLLFLGLLFVVMNSLNSQSSVREDFEHSVFSRSSLNTFLSLTLESGQDYSDEVAKAIREDNTGLLNYLNDTSFMILNNTFGEFNQDYHYTITNKDEIYIDLGAGCDNRNIESSSYPIPAGDGSTIHFRLDIC